MPGHCGDHRDQSDRPRIRFSKDDRTARIPLDGGLMSTALEVRTRAPTTAAELLALVEACVPTVEAAALVFDRDPPAELLPALHVLHTGIRTRSRPAGRWYGCDGDTGRIAELQQAARIPRGIVLLCVEGDTRWDRIHPATPLDLACLFAPPPS